MKSKGIHTLVGDYLTLLGVPFTEKYTEERLRKMPFPTMFGLSKLLEEYGIESEGYSLTDKEEIDRISAPYIAKMNEGYVIVTGNDGSEVSYITEGVEERMPREGFLNAFDGRVFLSFPSAGAAEPEYHLHRRLDFLMQAKKWVLGGSLLFLFIWAFIANGIYRHLSLILVSAIDLGGLYITYLLVQKSMNFHNDAADRVCGVLQAGGCDSILATPASKFFGLFGWSEVGFAYFSVSLLTLLLFPSMAPSLALLNACCLPFTVWSIWYQRFRAHKWCTLCVLVQCSLWLLFFCYLFGGWLRLSWPPVAQIVPLGISYLAVMLGVNALMPLIEKEKPDEE